MRLTRAIPLVVFAAAALALPSIASAAPGTFAKAGEFEVGQPFDIATVDFDDDGVVDVATPNANGSSANVLLGVGDGTFSEGPESPILTAASPLGVATGDLDADGDDDLVVVENGPDTVRVLLSDGDGTFTQAPGSPLTTGADPTKVAIATFDAGAVLDLAVVNRDFESPNGSVSVFLGNGSGGFAAAPSSPVAVGAGPTDLVAAQLSGDAHVDLAVSNSGGNTVSILLGSATGAFVPAPTSPETAGDHPSGLAAADLNGDAFLDLAVGNTFSNNTSILLGSASADFTQPLTSPEPEGGQSVTLAKFDADADFDLATHQDESNVAALSNDGAGGFSPFASSPHSVLGILGQVTSADTDSDGDQDLLAAGGNGGHYAVTSLLNDEPDADSDGFADIGDSCPTVVGANQGCPVSQQTLTLKYKKRAEAFKGTLTALEEPACAGPRVKVTVFQTSNSGEEKVGSAKTSAQGRFKLEKRVKRGKFFATTERTVDPLLGICFDAFSPLITVRP